ncbi:MAG: inositol monophosphatase [Chloroflexi bacterium]|nr:inositol monophosphatase [Chloroflexota bacterium]
MSSQLDLASILSSAETIAEKAARQLKQAYNQPQEIDYKGEIDLVTQADRAAEQLILAELKSAYPEHAILAEEGGGTISSLADHQGMTWLVDPLDGTTNFAHGFPVFSVAIALHNQDGPLVAVVYDVLRQECFSATRGGGATLNGQPIGVSTTDQLGRSLLATGFPYNRHEAEDNNAEATSLFIRQAQGIRRAGSAALDLAYVACGRLDGYWEQQLKPWDLAAGILLVTEAGGRLSSYRGADDYRSLLAGNDLVASNSQIHDAMLETLATIYS